VLLFVMCNYVSVFTCKYLCMFSDAHLILLLLLSVLISLDFFFRVIPGWPGPLKRTFEDH